MNRIYTKMDIVENWKEIRDHFKKSFKSNFYLSVASLDENNEPTITPIGSLFLNRDQTAFYFEKYPVRLAKAAELNNKICVLGVNSNTWFWIRSLLNGRFTGYPGIRLYGELGVRREASKVELSRLKRRMKFTKGTKGNKYLWGDMIFVREVVFNRAEKVNLGEMTKDL